MESSTTDDMENCICCPMTGILEMVISDRHKQSTDSEGQKDLGAPERTQEEGSPFFLYLLTPFVQAPKLSCLTLAGIMLPMRLNTNKFSVQFSGRIIYHANGFCS